ncbi:MAG: M56 family metallopeptidase [Verrucomicrobiales bacterium]|nr:M56 family metallopeptidase [Verrucomicrobiales bacterium]
MILLALEKTEPSWKIALIRGVFVGGLTLLLVSLSGIRWEIPGWVNAPIKAASPTAEIAPLPATAATTSGTVTKNSPLTETAKAPVNWTTPALLLWAAVSAILLLRLCLILQRERRLIRTGTRATSEITAPWERVCAGAGVKPGEVILVAAPVSPHLYLDGKLILPATLAGDPGAAESLVHVFRHEAAHLKAGDHFWFPFVSILTAMLWFHPLAWWLSTRHLVSCEEARDAEAARLGGTEAYRQSVAGVALGLLPSPAPTPSLIRKNGRLVQRLKRVETTSPQSPPPAATIRTVQSAIIIIALAAGLAAPSLEAALSSNDLFGMWRPDGSANRFARQLEVDEWGGEVKLRIWHSVGDPDKLHGATITSFEMTKEAFDEALSNSGSISVPHRENFKESIYTLSKRGDELEFRLQNHYTDDSGRADQDLVFFFERGEWSP